jgi:hypothetical protein
VKWGKVQTGRGGEGVVLDPPGEKCFDAQSGVGIELARHGSGERSAAKQPRS